MFKLDQRGWYRWELARIRAAWWLLVLLDNFWFEPWFHITRGRVMAHKSNVWLTLAANGYLIDDLKRGDMPENVRIGGVWR